MSIAHWHQTFHLKYKMMVKIVSVVFGCTGLVSANDIPHLKGCDEQDQSLTTLQTLEN